MADADLRATQRWITQPPLVVVTAECGECAGVERMRQPTLPQRQQPSAMPDDISVDCVLELEPQQVRERPAGQIRP